MKIQVEIKSQFGNRRIFPVCEKAHLFCAIAGEKTLTDASIKSIKALGYAIEVVQSETASL
jgi:hypothetical protein